MVIRRRERVGKMKIIGKVRIDAVVKSPYCVVMRGRTTIYHGPVASFSHRQVVTRKEL